jgi:hypothetical protein
MRPRPQRGQGWRKGGHHFFTGFLQSRIFKEGKNFRECHPMYRVRAGSRKNITGTDKLKKIKESFRITIKKRTDYSASLKKIINTDRIIERYGIRKIYGRYVAFPET